MVYMNDPIWGCDDARVSVWNLLVTHINNSRQSIIVDMSG